MKQLLLIIGLSLFVSQFGLANTDCTLLGLTGEKYNKNAVIGRKQYVQDNSRSLTDLFSVTESWGAKEEISLRSLVQSLDPKSTILDPGGGFSVYGIELALKNHKVISVNTQDFYKNLVEITNNRNYLIKEITNEYKKALASKRSNDKPKALKKFGYISIQSLETLAKALEIPIFTKSIRRVLDKIITSNPKMTHKKIVNLADQIILLASKIIQKINKGNIRENFVRKIGFMQNEIVHLKDNSIDLVIDFFGAILYSSDRVQLIESLYKKLSPGGHAFIFPGRNDFGNGKYLDYTMEDSGPSHIYDKLVKTMPEIFYLSKSAGYLVITKSKNKPILDLNLEIAEVEWVDRGEGIIVPSVRYQNRN